MERVRTYWYVIQSMDFFPYKYPDVDTEPEALKKLLSKDETTNAQIQGLQGVELIEKMRSIVRTLQDQRRKFLNRLDGWARIQNGIAAIHRAIEFRQAGSIPCNLFSGSFGTEKAVDVKLAVDLIILRDNYDVAIIVSGDQDYVPAAEKVKDFGKEVVNVAFETRKGNLLPGGAYRLNQTTDRSLKIKYDQLAKHLKL